MSQVMGQPAGHQLLDLRLEWLQKLSWTGLLQGLHFPKLHEGIICNTGLLNTLASTSRAPSSADA